MKVNGCLVAQNFVTAQIFLWAMPDEPQISLGQALVVFQSQISVIVNECHVEQNIVRSSNFF